MKRIEKKIKHEFFTEVLANTKTFELRKDEDDIQVGDVLILKEWVGHYTGVEIEKKVTYVLRDAEQYGLKKGHCVIGFR